MMDDCELEHLSQYLDDVDEKLTDRGLEFNKLYWISRWKQDTKADRIAYHASGQSFWRSND